MEKGKKDLKFADYWEAGQGWKWQMLTQKLSFSNYVLLASFALRPESEFEDSVGWLANGSRSFAVKKAYELARPSEEQPHGLGGNCCGGWR